MELSEEQDTILNEVLIWYKSGYSTSIKVVGYAGTGKTTLMTEISDRIRWNGELGRKGASSIAFCAYTGKAAFILQNKLRLNNSLSGADYVGTIHGLLYTPKYSIKNGKKIITGWQLRDELPYDFIILDEGSMVTREIWADLERYGIPILVSGDHGQLGPIGDNFALLKNADFCLHEIHRQALNNPIIQLTIGIRRTGVIPAGIYNEGVFKLNWNDPQARAVYDKINWMDDGKDIIQLCGFNKSRVALNKVVRDKFDFKLPDPYPSERIMCLKNNHKTGIKNGQLGSLVWVYNAGEELYDLTMQMDGYEGNLHSSLALRSSFGKADYSDEMSIDFKVQYEKQLKHYKQENIDLFDFGYATTVHKSQGSEWDKVVLFEQRNQYQSDQDYARWLYTAATRAKEKLAVFYNYW